jgi:nucleotide-binding universal stress UspA family protein/Icc-related predicted phosphoesterase
MRILVINNVDGRVDRLEALLATVRGRRAEAILVLGNLVKAVARRQAHAHHHRGRTLAADLKAEVAQELKDNQAAYEHIIMLLAQTGVPVYIIPGEHDAPLASLQHALTSCRDAAHVYLVHRQAVLLDAHTVVVGFGGKLEGTAHGDPYLLHFPDWEVQLAFEHINSFVPVFNLTQHRIFLFGTPLRGTHIDLKANQHTGVETLNFVCRAYQPQLVCCAGPGSGRGIETIDGAVVVNPGSLAHGSYGWIMLDGQHVTAELGWLHTPVHLQTLVVAIDGSEESWSALDLVPALTQRGTTNVVLVHAFEPVNDAWGYPYYDSRLERRLEHGEHLLKQAADALKELAPRCELVEGSPADAIVRIAEQQNADLILMGSRGLGRLRGLLGSVSQQVLHRAPCPVLVAPGVAYQPADMLQDQGLEQEFSSLRE